MSIVASTAMAEPGQPADREGLSVLGHRLGPALVLFVLAPVFAELLSGSSPPLVFFFPILTALNLCLYGSGAVLIREAAVRWRLGWPGIFALGVAYGILEEGIALTTFFDPAWPARRDLDGYGAGPDGANWIWISSLCVYHSVISMALPILMAQLAYPSRARQPWLRRRALALMAVLLLAAVVILRGIVSSGAADSQYHAHITEGQQTLSILAMAGLVLLARKLPRTWAPAADPGAAPSPRRVTLTVLAATFVFFFGFAWGAEGLGLPVWAALTGIVALPLLMAYWLAHASARAGWSDLHRFAVPAGVTLFFIGLGPIQELRGGRGMVIVALVAIVLLGRGWRRYERVALALGTAS
jgi:hypothetical protein